MCTERERNLEDENEGRKYKRKNSCTRRNKEEQEGKKDKRDGIVFRNG